MLVSEIFTALIFSKLMLFNLIIIISPFYIFQKHFLYFKYWKLQLLIFMSESLCLSWIFLYLDMPLTFHFHRDWESNRCHLDYGHDAISTRPCLFSNYKDKIIHSIYDIWVASNDLTTIMLMSELKLFFSNDTLQCVILARVNLL